jgi:hypothetical protein
MKYLPFLTPLDSTVVSSPCLPDDEEIHAACGHLETNERCSKDKSEGREDGRNFAITSSNNDVREDEQRYRAPDQERSNQIDGKQPEMERGRSPLVSTPPWQVHRSSTTSIRLNFRPAYDVHADQCLDLGHIVGARPVPHIAQLLVFKHIMKQIFAEIGD